MMLVSTINMPESLFLQQEKVVRVLPVSTCLYQDAYGTFLLISRLFRLLFARLHQIGDHSAKMHIFLCMFCQEVHYTDLHKRCWTRLSGAAFLSRFALPNRNVHFHHSFGIFPRRQRQLQVRIMHFPCCQVCTIMLLLYKRTFRRSYFRPADLLQIR